MPRAPARPGDPLPGPELDEHGRVIAFDAGAVTLVGVAPAEVIKYGRLSHEPRLDGVRPGLYFVKLAVEAASAPRRRTGG